jgi:hypothetical protein
MGIVEPWLKYVLTLSAILTRPSDFYSGAFSRFSKVYHHRNGTQTPVEFFLSHFIFTGLLTVAFIRTVLGVPSFSGDTGLTNGLENFLFERIIDSVNLVLAAAYMYLPSCLVYLAWDPPEYYHKSAASVWTSPLSKKETFERILQATIYASAIDIFAIPTERCYSGFFT